MVGLNGDFQENDDGDILQAYTYIGPNNNWHLLDDFRSHRVHEMWNIDLLCVNHSAAELVGDWSEGWVR